MMKHGRIALLSLVLAVTAGCATLPAGPSVRVMPGQGKSFEQFRTEDADCRNWAGEQIGAPPQERANQNVATGSVAGTAIGAALGAAIGSVSGHAGTGAAIGAGTGLLAGAATGANAGQVYGWEAQRRFDMAYQQCMYAKGNEVPMRQRRQIERWSPPGEENGPDDTRY